MTVGSATLLTERTSLVDDIIEETLILVFFVLNDTILDSEGVWTFSETADIAFGEGVVFDDISDEVAPTKKLKYKAQSPSTLAAERVFDPKRTTKAITIGDYVYVYSVFPLSEELIQDTNSNSNSIHP